MAAAAFFVISAMLGKVEADEYPIGDKVTMWADPYLIGSLRHVGEIFPSRLVHRGAIISDLPRGEPVASLDYELRGQKFELEDYFERNRTTGLIVLKDGRIVFERYRLGADERSLFMSMSVSKSVVSTLVGLAIDEGLIGGVDDPISDYLAELGGSGYEGVPIKAVLQMSSGVDFFESYSASDSDFNRMWTRSVLENTTPITEFVRQAKARYDPFSRFHYAAVETVVLAWLVTHVTGKTLSDYLSEKLWVLLGMEADGNWVVDGSSASSREVAFCCLSATLRDYARFGLLKAQDGVWQGRRLLPPGWVREATRPDRPQVQPGKLYLGSSLGYQYQWWTFPGEDGAFTARGVNGQFVYVNPAETLVVVLTGVWPYWWSENLEAHTYAVFDAFAKMLRD